MQLPAKVAKNLGLWKEQYNKLYLFELDDNIYVYRCLNRKELEVVSGLFSVSGAASFFYLIEKLLLYPDILIDEPAGHIVNTVTKVFEKESEPSLTSIRNKIDDGRSSARTIYAQAAMIIAQTTNLSYDDIYGLDSDTFWKLLAVGEILVGDELQIEDEIRTDESGKMIVPGGSPEEVRQYAETKKSYDEAVKWRKQRGLEEPLAPHDLPDDLMAEFQYGHPSVISLKQDQEAAINHLKQIAKERKKRKVGDKVIEGSFSGIGEKLIGDE